MDSSKRRRFEDADRLGDLPDCLLHDVLSRLGPWQAVRTSVLSRRWRHLWRDVLRDIVVIDERDFAGVQWERFEDFADRLLLSIPAEKELDFFHLNLVTPRGTSNRSFETSDRWIRRGLRHCPAAVDIRAADEATISWEPHLSYFDSAPRQQPDLSVGGLCAAGFTRRLTTLRLVRVCVSGPRNFLEDLGRYCPVLEDLHVESCRMMNLRAVASPTLRSLAIIGPQRPLACPHLRIATPLLAHLRLELLYNGGDCYCVAAALRTTTQLASLAEASIRLTDTSLHQQPKQRARTQRKLQFLKSMRGFLALLPNVVQLRLAGFAMVLLEEESQEFTLHHCLKTLIFEECDLGVEVLAGILQNIPDVEKLGLYHCTFIGPPAKKKRKRSQQPSKGRSSTPSVFWCEKLKLIQIKRRQEDEPDLAMVLSEISERMQREMWRRVKISTTIG